MISVTERARSRAGDDDHCHAPGCQRLTQKSAGNGLSASYCKVHVNFHARHGSYWRKSFSAAELSPFLTAARSWVMENGSASLVAGVIARLRDLMGGAGPAVSAYDLRFLPAAEKARVALARLREAAVPGARLLEIALAVSALAEHEGMTDPKFVEVQIAKAVHRLASGTHTTTSGLPIKAKYSPSSGQALQILGHSILDLAAVVADASAVATVDHHATPLIPKAAKAETERQNALAVQKKTREAIERRVKQARDYGMGPHSLSEMRRKLLAQYGLK